MRVYVLGEEIMDTERGDGACVLEYAVLVCDIRSESGNTIGESYGIRIRMTKSMGVPGEVDWRKTACECERVTDVTTRGDKILRLARKLQRGRVTPSHLRDVVMDSLPL